MQSIRNTHRCQVDCTNHDEVINGLEMKSKDLYFFWKNYEWLYNKYYGQSSQSTARVAEPNSNKELEEEVSRLTSQNRKLRIDVETYKKQIEGLGQNSHWGRMEQQYKKQIERLKSKCQSYKSIQQKLEKQVQGLKKDIRVKEDSFEEKEREFRKKIKSLQQYIVELQRKIDAPRAAENQNHLIIEEREKYVREIQRMGQVLRSIQAQAQNIIQEEFEQAKAELASEFSYLMGSLGEANQSRFVTVETYESNRVEG